MLIILAFKSFSVKVELTSVLYITCTAGYLYLSGKAIIFAAKSGEFDSIRPTSGRISFRT
jgi:hypothetical protein